MSSFVFKEPRISLEITARELVDFKSIDPRIKQDTAWSEVYPPSTSVSMPAAASVELIAKIKAHSGIKNVRQEGEERKSEVSMGLF